MSQLNVLVCGAGIAGSVVAYWLGKAGINVTVIERAPELRVSGQGIDVRGRALDIVRKMGVEDEIRTKTTKEEGTVFVDENNNSLLTLDVDGSQSFTAEIEIIRSDLARILYEASLTTNHVKYEFGVSISETSQTGSKVTVGLSNGESRDYDLVIAADGVSSRTRTYILGPDESKSSYKTLNAFVAYFSIPSEPQDSSRSRWYTATGRRSIMLRPVTPSRTSAYVTVLTPSPAPRAAFNSNDIDTQKSFVTSTFSDLSWETPRVLKAMATAGPADFYFQELAQIKVPGRSWHRGRCALVGDAAYCPSAFTGMGTTAAILGAYILAGEIAMQARKPSPDFEAAFEMYEDRLGGWVEEVQRLPLDGRLVDWVNPASVWGLSLLRWALWIVDRMRLVKLFERVFGDLSMREVELPEYTF